jgi:hypothetical protein
MIFFFKKKEGGQTKDQQALDWLFSFLWLLPFDVEQKNGSLKKCEDYTRSHLVQNLLGEVKNIKFALKKLLFG